MQDLGGLGATEGRRVRFPWAHTGLAGAFVPWLALLVLLALKPNRALGAWWIWAGVLGSSVVPLGLRLSAGLLPSRAMDMLIEMANCLSLGMAAVWLLAYYISWNNRFATLISMLGIASAFGAAACLLCHRGELLLTLLGAAIAQLTLSLTGLLCRKFYSPLRLLTWSVVMAPAAAALVLVPFFGFSVLQSPDEVPVEEFAQFFGAVAGMSLGTVLAYLVPCVVTPFYRQRCISLLQFGEQEPPRGPEPAEAVQLLSAR